MDLRVKICGLTDRAGVEAAVEGGAAYLGFNFFHRSPRYVDPAAAGALAALVPPGICKVALSVDAGDAELDTILATLPADMIQLHGAETPARVRAVRDRYRLPVMKAIGIGDKGDLAEIDRFAAVADQLLIDTRPPAKAALPGGNGVAFDWSLVAGRRWTVPWLLAGGLTAETVAEAVRRSGATQVDVSSGVESTRGRKDPALIRGFLGAARSAVAA